MANIVRLVHVEASHSGDWVLLRKADHEFQTASCARQESFFCTEAQKKAFTAVCKGPGKAAISLSAAP